MTHMAQKVEVTLIDDLDGCKADEDCHLRLDGAQYVIDLSQKNATKLRESLAKYAAIAARSGPCAVCGRGISRKQRRAA